MEIRHPKNEFWQNRRVLITGNTGFKGAWLTKYLDIHKSILRGISLNASVSTPNLFSNIDLSGICETTFLNICEIKYVQDVINHFKPEIIIHLAAESLVSEANKFPFSTYKTNTLGTLSILEAAVTSVSPPGVILVVTTDKVYWPQTSSTYTEQDLLGATDTYSASKVSAEYISRSYNEFFGNEVKIATARSGNVYGGYDWAKNRIIPDYFRALLSNSVLQIRNKNAIRPWQYILDTLRGYLLFVEDLFNGKTEERSLNFGPNISDNVKVYELIEILDKSTNFLPVKTIEVQSKYKEINSLKLNSERALEFIKYSPAVSLHEGIARTTSVYLHKLDLDEIVTAEIMNYNKIKFRS